jgi:glycosyltransferase involved in cell wall biosynthesis
VSPRDSTALRDAITRALADDGLRREMRARGPAYASRFRWESSAAIMRDLLRDAGDDPNMRGKPHFDFVFDKQKIDNMVY